MTERRYYLAGSGLVAACVAVLAVLGDAVREQDGLAHRDATILQDIVDHRSTALVTVSRLVTALGAFGVLGVLATMATVVLWRRGVAATLALAPLASLVVGAVLARAGKTWFHRSRPPAALRLVGVNEPAFPSGHATQSTAFFVTLALVLAATFVSRRRGRIGLAAATAAIVVAVGVSRLVLGVHWPSDVVAGWALGLSVAVATTMVAARPSRRPVRRRPSDAARPAAMSCGGAKVADERTVP